MNKEYYILLFDSCVLGDFQWSKPVLSLSVSYRYCLQQKFSLYCNLIGLDSCVQKRVGSFPLQLPGVTIWEGWWQYPFLECEESYARCFVFCAVPLTKRPYVKEMKTELETQLLSVTLYWVTHHWLKVMGLRVISRNSAHGITLSTFLFLQTLVVPDKWLLRVRVSTGNSVRYDVGNCILHVKSMEICRSFTVWMQPVPNHTKVPFDPTHYF